MRKQNDGSTLRFALSALAALIILPAHSPAMSDEDTATADPVFDLEAIFTPPLNARVLKKTVADGVVTEEVMFHSEMDGEKSVDIFAFFCYPEGARKFPAFVWNQSGAAKASTYFPLLGARRGYATLCIDLPIPGYRSTGGYPISSGLALGDDPRQAPIYHGAVALLRAVSFLQSRAEVDPDRIGMAGSSWGGFFTTLMTGIDPRLKAASAMFGTGSLQLGNAWWDNGPQSSSFDAAHRERWRTTLDPALRLSRRSTPIAWFTGTNDGFYWMSALMQTYSLAAGAKHLTLLPNWDHGLTPPIDDQVFAWLDAHLKGGTAFLTLSPVTVKKDKGKVTATWSFRGPRDVQSADLMLSYGDARNWVSRYWKVLPAQIRDGTCSVELPSTPMPYYIAGSVSEANGYRYSTPLIRIDPVTTGLVDAKAAIEYDGCSLWGSFEKDAVQYLKALALMRPINVSQDARSGEQALVVNDSLRLAPCYFTAGVPHRFACFMKSAAPVEVTLDLAHATNGEATHHMQTFTVSNQWAELTVDVPHAATGRYEALRATVSMPKGSEAVLDDVSYRPIAGP